MACISGFSINTIYDKLRILGLSPEFTKSGLNYYNDNTFNMVLKALENAPKEKSFTKFYPIKTIETFYIYESKMNYDNKT